jgi:hypothetical protein
MAAWLAEVSIVVVRPIRAFFARRIPEIGLACAKDGVWGEAFFPARREASPPLAEPASPTSPANL